MYLRYMIFTKTLTNPRGNQTALLKMGVYWKTDEFQHVGTIQCSENQASIISDACIRTLK